MQVKGKEYLQGIVILFGMLVVLSAIMVLNGLHYAGAL